MEDMVELRVGQEWFYKASTDHTVLIVAIEEVRVQYRIRFLRRAGELGNLDSIGKNTLTRCLHYGYRLIKDSGPVTEKQLEEMV